MGRAGALLVLGIVLIAVLPGCSTEQLINACRNAGGRYTDGGCDTSTPASRAAKEWCETHGGVYLAGQNYCAYGMGGA
jgi:hypothetical protein